MNGADQNRFVFQMSRILSIARLMEARCQGLFIGLIAAQRLGREEAAKKEKARKERKEMRLELTAAQAAIAKAAATLATVRQQYSEQLQEQQQEGHDEKVALQCLLEDERLTTRELRRGLKKAEATIAYLNTRLLAIESGSRDKDAVRNDLQLKLTAAAAAEATSATKWEENGNSCAMRSSEPGKNATTPWRRSAMLRPRRRSISGGGPDWPGSPRTATVADRWRT